MSKEISILANSAISALNNRITDEIFLQIQKDKLLMKKYLELIENEGLSTVNKMIGKIVKSSYALKNADYRDHTPKSTLIFSYQALE